MKALSRTLGLAGALAASTGAFGCSNRDYAGPICRTRATHVGIGSSVTLCPTITSYDVEPASIEVGGTVTLSGAATDPDTPTLSYSWSATSGQVAAPNAAETTFRCAAPGNVSLTFTASDGRCTDSVTTLVQCLPCADGGACGRDADR